MNKNAPMKVPIAAGAANTYTPEPPPVPRLALISRDRPISLAEFLGDLEQPARDALLKYVEVRGIGVMALTRGPEIVEHFVAGFALGVDWARERER